MIGQSDKLSIMHVILTLERAGAQEVVRTLTKLLRQDGHAVTVCAFEDGPMRADIEKLGVHVEIIRRPRHSVALLPLFLVEILRIRRELARLIDTYHVDLVQTHLLQVLDFVVLSLRFTTRLRVVLWTITSVEFLPRQMPSEKLWLQRLKRSGYLLMYRFLSRLADGFVAVSDEVRRSIVEQVGPARDKVFTICNGVDLTQFGRSGDRKALCHQMGVGSSTPLIATVGRLTEEKGHRCLIDAATSVVRLFPEARFVIVGDGELRAPLRSRVEQVGLSEHFHFLGIRDDIPDLLAAIDLFVLPSLWEGLSIALLEAMAAAKPIVATAVSGTAQAMTDGETGLVVPPGDSRALAEAILELLRDPARADAMGQAARERVERSFSAERQVGEYLALYRRLLRSEDPS